GCLVDPADAVAEDLAAGAAECSAEAAALAFLQEDDRDQEDRVDREKNVEDGGDDSHRTLSSRLLRRLEPADAVEVLLVEARSAHEGSVDVRHGHQAIDVVRFDA